jgi:calcineurin-like phosphoesterase family protein
MKFRDDIDLEKTYVVSDTHFGHDNIVGFCHRPPDHESIMMERWAQAVPEDATVIHLGDISYRRTRFFERMVAPHLTGARKLLILGNHDTARPSLYRAAGFQIAMPFMLPVSPFGDSKLYVPGNYRGLTVDQAQSKWVVSFAHYPWGEREDVSGPIPDNHIRVHGHIHNNGYFREGFVPFLRNHINISIEQTKYRPVNLANLLSGYLLGTVQVTADDVQKGIAQTHEKKKKEG